MFEYCCGTSPSWLKVIGGWWWAAYWILVSAPVPFGFRSYWNLVGVRPRGFGTKGLGTGLDNLNGLVTMLLYNHESNFKVVGLAKIPI